MVGVIIIRKMKDIEKESLDNSEKETIINFNKMEKEASIFTYEKTWQKYLEKKLGLEAVSDNGFGAKEYIIDKSRIRLPLPLRNKKEKIDESNKSCN